MLNIKAEPHNKLLETKKVTVLSFSCGYMIEHLGKLNSDEDILHSREYAGPALDVENFETQQRVSLTAYGRPGFFTVFINLIG